MIIRLSSVQQKILESFLNDARHVPMPKDMQQALTKARLDVLSGQVNSQRFERAYPGMQAVHSRALSAVAQAFAYKNVKRWQRILFPIGLIVYYLVVLPRRTKYEQALAAAAQAVAQVRSKYIPPSSKGTP